MKEQNSRPAPRPPGTMPRAEGLYDPRFEHDSCGVGFVVNIKGERSHKLVRQAFEVSVNLLHRGACGCEVNTGDGAGMLLQLPHKFFHKAADAAGFELPEPGSYGVGMVFLPRDAVERQRVEETFGRIVREEGQRLLGWRDVPTDSGHLGATARSGEPVIRQIFIGRGPALDDTPGRRRTLRAQAVRHPQPGGARGRPPAASRARPVLRRQPLVQHDRLQGDADRGSGRADVPRPGGSRRRVGAGARAFPVQHEHVPVVAAGPPVPLHRPQRRDQHAARQHQLDAGPRGAVPVRSVRGRPAEAVPAHPRGPERHRDVRQRAGVPGPDRPAPGARGPDDDPRAVEQPRVDESGAAGVLRVPRLAHGAVGRPGVDRLHRRHRHRGGARPQRAAALALLRDEGRHGDHGVRGGRPRHPAGERPGQGAAAPGPHLPGRHGAGAHRRRRGDQARPRPREALRRVAEAGAGACRRPAPGARRPGRAAGTGAYPAARLRLHRGGPADNPRADGAERRRADRLDGHRHGACGPLGSLAAAVRLLQAALRAGHESAARRDPRGAGDRHGLDARRRGQPAGAGRALVPPRQGGRAGDHERRAGQAPAHRRPRVPFRDAAHAVRSARRRGGPREGHGRAVPPGERGGRRRRDAARAVGPRGRSRARAGPGPARHGRGAPPPRARRHPHALLADRRDRRGPRVPPHGAARRLRRGGHQPVSRFRDHRGAAGRGRGAGRGPGGTPFGTTSRRAPRAC